MMSGNNRAQILNDVSIIEALTKKAQEKVKMLENIGISIKDLELMDDREICIVFENAGLDPLEYEI